MYSKILVPLDGSRPSESILPYARFFAETLKVPVELLHVIDPRTLNGFGSSIIEHARYHDVQAALAPEREKSCEYLKKIAFCLPDSLAVDCTVEVGKPARVIVDEASAIPGTLIAMATHGHSGVEHWLLGGMADKVLRKARNDLLLVRTREETNITRTVSLKSVILPLDGSETAETVLPGVAELAKKMNLEILLLRAFDLPMTYRAEGAWSNSEWIRELVKDAAKDDLDKKLQQLKEEGWTRVTPMALEGDATGRTIDLAQKRPESLVAISAQWESAVTRWLSGGIADDIIGHSGRPVLVVCASMEGGANFARRFFSGLRKFPLNTNKSNDRLAPHSPPVVHFRLER